MALIDPDESDVDGRAIGARGRSLVTGGGAVHNRREFVVGKPAASLSEVSPEAARWKPGATQANPGKSLSLGLSVLATVPRRGIPRSSGPMSFNIDSTGLQSSFAGV